MRLRLIDTVTDTKTDHVTAFAQEKYKTDPDIADVNEYEHSKALKDRITDYWAGRSDAQFIQRRSELYSPLADA